MKSILLLVIFMSVLCVPSLYADSYRLAVGKILHVKQNKVEVNIFSKICTGKHLVTVKNADKIPTDSLKHKNVILLINSNCSRIFLIHVKKGGIQ